MFSDDFKTKVFKISLPAGYARRAITAFETNNHVLLRYLLEDLLADSRMYVDGNIGYNREVKPDCELTFQDRQNIYSEFMEILTEKLDNGELLPEYRVRI